MESEDRSLRSLEEDARIVPCEACGTEGRIYEACWVYDRGCGFAYPDQHDTGPCPYCDGPGGEIIMTLPITLEDLEETQASNASGHQSQTTVER